MDYIPWIITTATSLIIGIISFFVKRTFNEMSDKIKNLNEQKISRPEFDKNNDLVQKHIDEHSSDIKEIKNNYLTKEDFYREQHKTDRKLDQIMNILLEMKGESGKNGQK